MDNLPFEDTEEIVPDTPTILPEYPEDTPTVLPEYEDNVVQSTEENDEEVQEEEEELLEITSENSAQTIEETIICLHNDVHFLVNDFLPFSIAIVIVYLFCLCFYKTFCRI